MADYPWINLAEVCKLKYSIKKPGRGDPLCMVLVRSELEKKKCSNKSDSREDIY
jgi:hypothetical protein